MKYTHISKEIEKGNKLTGALTSSFLQYKVGWFHEWSNSAKSYKKRKLVPYNCIKKVKYATGLEIN